MSGNWICSLCNQPVLSAAAARQHYQICADLEPEPEPDDHDEDDSEDAA